MPAPTLSEVAFHEAAHCAMALLFGMRVKEVSCQPSSPGLLGHCEYYGRTASASQVLRIAVAGMVGQRKHSGRRLRRSYEGRDRRQARTLAKRIDPDYVTETIWGALREVKAKLNDSDVWKGVTALADALQVHGQLSGLEATEIFFTTCWGVIC